MDEPQEQPSDARAGRSRATGLRLAFWVLSGGFLAACIWLAAINQSPGGPDARNNLDTARNLATGKGFRSNIIQQLFVEQPLPNPETIRPPGVPFLMAGLFRVFGISLAIPVLVNAVAALLAAWVLRYAVRAGGGGWFGDLAGIFVLLSAHYELVSVLNNNLLVLCTALLLLLVAVHRRAWFTPLRLALVGAVLAAVGFYIKPTFVLAVVPTTACLLLFRRSDEPLSRTSRVAAFAVFLLALGLLTSPYWIRNLVLFGQPIYSPWTAVRLSERYFGLPYGTWRTVRFGQPLTYGEMASIHGWGGLIRSEIGIWLMTGYYVMALSPAVFVLAAFGAVLHWNRSNWKRYLLPLLPMAGPLFSVGYMYLWPRYLWPVFPCLLYLAGQVIRDYTDWGRTQLAGQWRSRLRPLVGATLVLGLIIAGMGARLAWRDSLMQARQRPGRPASGRYRLAEDCGPPGAWIGKLKETPPDSIVLTDDPSAVAWYTERRAVVCPAGSREDLLKVLRLYRPDYYLHTGLGYGGGSPALGDEDLELIAKGLAKNAEWTLHRLKLSPPGPEP